MESFLVDLECEAGRHGGAAVSRSFEGTRLDLYDAGWTQWTTTDRMGRLVCPACWGERTLSQLESYFGPAREYRTVAGSALPHREVHKWVVPGDEWRKHLATLEEVERALERTVAVRDQIPPREEIEATLVASWEWEFDTEVGMSEADAPTARTHALSIPLDATPEMVARDVLQLEVLGLAGRGALGTVLKVRDGGRVLAFKYIHGAAEHPQAFERLRREVAVMQALDHPNIVKIVASHADRGIPSYLMEFVDGLPLNKLLDGGALSLHRATTIAEGVCLALAHAHAQGVVHRDVKPANVLIGRDGEIKLSDFGIAKLARDLPDVFTLTETGDQLGTPAYMAPEQRGAAHKVDHRADLYSVGVMVWAMLSGNRPRQGGDGRVALDALVPSMPRVDAIIARATARDPAARQPSAQVLAQELLAARLAL